MTFDDIFKHSISPRPICFASTIDKDGNVNLSPFSYFNMMGQNPPICVFSPLRRMRDGSTKHTLENILEHPSKHFRKKFRQYLNALMYWNQQYKFTSEELVEIINNTIFDSIENTVGPKSLSKGELIETLEENLT